jgi:hypothetical protein
MSCQDYRDLFDSVFDKEIKESRKKKLFAHLEKCTECSLQFKLYEAMIDGMEKLEEVEAPLDLTSNVMQGIRTEAPAWEGQALPFMRPASTSWVWAGAFAVAFFLMIGTFVNSDGSGNRQVQLPTQQQPAKNPVGEVPLLGEDRTYDELTPRQPRTSAPEGQISLVQHSGEVEVYDAATGNWRAIMGMENLNHGERVRTGPTGVASLEYKNPSVALRIKPNTVLQVLNAQTLRMFAGNAWVSVKRKGTIFRTETPNAIASVRGTKYSVEVQPLADVYRREAALALHAWVAPKQTGAKPTHNAPHGSSDLAAYSTQMAFHLMRTMADANLPTKVDTQVKVYESVVEVTAKNAQGVEVSAIDVSEGFKSRVQLAMVSKPNVLSENDLLDWKGVMIFDQDLLTRARNKAAGSVGGSTGNVAAGAASTSYTAPAAGATGGAATAEPTSTTERPSGYDDVNRR